LNTYFLNYSRPGNGDSDGNGDGDGDGDGSSLQSQLVGRQRWGALQLQASLGKKSVRPHFNEQSRHGGLHACHPNYVEGIDRKIMIPGQPLAKMQEIA
jgi:hypothetical protein